MIRFDTDQYEEEEGCREAGSEGANESAYRY